MPNAVPTPAPDRGAAARADPRKNLFLTATLAVGGISRAVRVRNLSASGALVEGATLPATGIAVILQRGSLDAECELVWQANGRGGLKFTRPINLGEWLPGATPNGQAAVDLSVAHSRAAGRSTAPPSLVPEPAPEVESGLLHRVADELAFVSRRLEALGNALTNDIHVVLRHPTSLQELDISMQILGHLSTMLAAERPAEAVDAIGMTDLRKRLQRKERI